jgi:enoyl-CoA hydratase/carnithine racemase
MTKVVIEQRGVAQVIRINRPEARNALSHQVTAALGYAIEAAEADPAIRVIVVTGTGDRAFSAGMDLREFSEGRAAGESDRRGHESYMRFIREGYRKPVIGAANATAAGGGFELLLACDLIIASDSASFSLPEVSRGLFPAAGGVHLGRKIATAVALELILTGKPIDAYRALQLGLVNRVVPAARVLTEALDLAEIIGRNGPLAVQVAKELAVFAADSTKAEAWQRQDTLRPVVYESYDAREGARAFIEKRDPNWSSR